MLEILRTINLHTSDLPLFAKIMNLDLEEIIKELQTHKSQLNVDAHLLAKIIFYSLSSEKSKRHWVLNNLNSNPKRWFYFFIKNKAYPGITQFFHIKPTYVATENKDATPGEKIGRLEVFLKDSDTKYSLDDTTGTPIWKVTMGN